MRRVDAVFLSFSAPGSFSTPGQAGAIERPDRWSLPYQDLRVTQLRLDAQLTLVLDEAGEITVSTPAVLIPAPARGPWPVPVRIAPHRQEVAGALELFGARVLAAVAFKDGRLRLLFDGGAQLHVAPDSWYEAWSVIGPGTLRAVCLPRGGLAIWA
jgi:hypothetical protein